MATENNAGGTDQSAFSREGWKVDGLRAQIFDLQAQLDMSVKLSDYAALRERLTESTKLLDKANADNKRLTEGVAKAKEYFKVKREFKRLRDKEAENP